MNFRLWMALSAFMANALISLLSSVACAEPSLSQKPVVYSGTVHNNKSNQDIRMRLFFLQQPKLGQAAPSTSVFGMLYFGAEGTHEYVSLYYDPINVNQANREIMLFRDDDARSRRLPTISLKFNEDLSELKGVMVSQTESVVGPIALKNGWDFGAGSYIDEIGGIYDASDCKRTDGASMKFEEIEILPSRLHQEKLAPEGMFGETNYVGNGLCNRLGHVNCLSFSSGSYNFIQGRVDLHQGTIDWVCKRLASDDMECRNSIMKTCRIKRTHRLQAPTFQPVSNPSFEKFSWQNSVAATGTQDCSRWEGDFRGIMTHRLAGRQQYVDVRLNSFHSGTADGVNKCIITGSAKLYFAVKGSKYSALTFPIINIEMNAANDAMVFHSDAYSDLALQLSIGADNTMTGVWYSRLFGLVGNFNARKDEQLFESIDASRTIYSFEGIYTNAESKIFQLDLRAIEAGFDKSSHDPFVQLKVQGNMLYGGGYPISNSVATWDAFVNSSYDYFTNFYVMRGNATYSGYIDQVGIHARASSNKYLTIVNHTLDKVTEFRRD